MRSVERSPIPPVIDDPRHVVYLNPRSFTYIVDDDGPHIYMYGSGIDNRTVFAQVSNFFPYCYLLFPKSCTRTQQHAFLQQLNKVLKFLVLQQDACKLGRHVYSRVIRKKTLITKISSVTGIPVRGTGQHYGYFSQRTHSFIQVHVFSPSLIPLVRRIIESLPCTSIEELYNKLMTNKTSYSSTDAPVKKDDNDTRTLQEYLDYLRDDAGQADATVLQMLEEDREQQDDVQRTSMPNTFTLDKYSTPIYNELAASSSFFRCTDISVFEADIEFIIRFCVDVGFAPEEWIYFNLDDPNVAITSHTIDVVARGDVEVYADYRSLHRADEIFQSIIPPQLCLSLDAEMENFGSFPKAESEKILQVCIVCFDPNADPNLTAARYYAFVLKKLAYVAREREYMYEFDREENLLLGVGDFIRQVQPDMVTGWNIENFDLTYFLDRAKILGIHDTFASCTRAPGKKIYSKKSSFQSRAHGTHVFSEVKGEGMWIWDLFLYFKRSTSYKLRSYALDAVSSSILKENKNDVAYSEIVKLQQTPEGRTRLMKYCMQDSILPSKLIGREKLLLENIAFARNTNVPIEWICRKGLQIRIAGLLYGGAKKEEVHNKDKYIFATRTHAEKKASENDEYQGAHVFKPKVGYRKYPVAVLDFASLYPSIIRTFNLGPTTIMPLDRAKQYITENHLTRDDVWWFEDFNTAVLKSHKYSALLALVISDLLALRKEAKSKMKSAVEGSLEESIYDKQQLAIKVNANSVYGSTGASVSRFYTPIVAALVCYLGRKLIQLSAELVEKKYTRANGYDFDVDIVYGDSVTGDTPVLLREKLTGYIFTRRCDEFLIGNTWIPYHGDKEAIDICKYQIWSDTGFTDIKRVIRHKCNKPIHRIITTSGVVDVTSDHSLLLENGTKVTPKQVSLGTTLLHASMPSLPKNDKTITKEQAYLLGLSFAHKAQGICISTEQYESIRKLTTKYNSHKEYIVPKEILHAPIIVAKRFLKGYSDGKHKVAIKGIPEYLGGEPGKETLMGLELLYRKVGKRYRHESRKDRHDIKDMYVLHETYNDYVYDFETTSHHFHVGPGRLVVHNTDSIFVEIISDKKLEEVAVISEEMAQYVTHELRNRYGHRIDNILVLEFEKIYFPLILYAPKKYANCKYEYNKAKELINKGVTTNGLETVRRDSCRLVANGAQQVLYMLLSHEIDKTLEQRMEDVRVFIAKMIHDVESNNVSFYQLIQSKQFRRLVEEYQEQGRVAPIHIELVIKLMERYGADSAEVPSSGDRIQHIVTEHEDIYAKTSMCGELPLYAFEHDMKPNKKYYIESAIIGTFGRLLEPMLVDDNTHFINEGQRKRARNELTSNFVQVKLDMQDTISIKKRKTTSQFGSHAVVLRRCALCGRKTTQDVCDKHEESDELAEYQSHKKRKLQHVNVERRELYNTCYNCVNKCNNDQNVPNDIEEIHKMIPCPSESCEFFWKRLQNDAVLFGKDN